MVEPDRVHTKLGTLEEYVRGLEEKQDCSEDEYRRDEDRQHIVERRFELAIQACLDIASHIVASEGFREPQDYGDLFRVLEEEGVLGHATADQMVEMAGFRNVLAHEYSAIVDSRVHAHLQDVARFRSYATEVHRFIAE